MDLEAEILRVLEADMARPRRGEVWGAVARNIGREVPEEAFDASVEALLEAGRVRIVKSGGVEKLVPQDGAQPGSRRSRSARSVLPAEAELMPALENWLGNEFRSNIGAKARSVFKDTSRGGSRAGVWTRPDFTMAAVRQHAFSMVREVELYGFELKRAESGSVVGVHEALAHTRFVHYAYVVWHVPAGEFAALDVDVIRSECARHGVGLVLFSEPDRLESWRIEVDPLRRSPGADDVDGYIEDRFDADQKVLLKEWLSA